MLPSPIDCNKHINIITSFFKLKFQEFFICRLHFLSSITRVRAMIVGRDSSVGIVIRYGLNGPGIESQ